MNKKAFETVFYEALKNRKTAKGNSLTDSTKKLYFSKIRVVKELVSHETNDLDFIFNHEEVIEAINNSSYQIASIKSIYTALYVVAVEIAPNSEVVAIYRKQMEAYRDINNTERKENVITNDERWTSWENIKKVFDMIGTENIENCRDKVIIGLFTRMKNIARLVYHDVHIIKSREEIENMNMDTNYLLWHVERNEFRFVINNYKNKDKMGQLTYLIDDKAFCIVLRKWFRKYNTEQKYLLVNLTDVTKPMTTGALSKRLKFIFKKHINLEITNQILRRIVTSYYFDNPDYAKLTTADQEKLQNRMTHSLNTALEYKKISQSSQMSLEEFDLKYN